MYHNLVGPSEVTWVQTRCIDLYEDFSLYNHHCTAKFWVCPAATTSLNQGWPRMPMLTFFLFGIGKVTTSRTSGGPHFLYCTAFMMFPGRVRALFSINRDYDDKHITTQEHSHL
jgi:hypothetical protein